MTDKILQKIKEYDKIIISRHIRPDGDAVGSTKGLYTILKDSFPKKEIKLINEDYSDFTSFLGPEDCQVDDDYYYDALLIVLDTATRERISNKKFRLAKEIIKIDHHIDVAPYGDISWVEEEASSACQLVVQFYQNHKDELVLSKEAATYIYTGMVTDSGRFRFSSTSSETLRMAAILLDAGIDLETLYAHLYLEDLNHFRYKSYVYEKMGMTEHGVAYIIADKEMQDKFDLTPENAGLCVSFLDGIKGSIFWLAFIEDSDGTFRVRLRTRFMTCNKLAEKYRGGGHAQASGGHCMDLDEVKALISDADALTKEYKETHTNWM